MVSGLPLGIAKYFFDFLDREAGKTLTLPPIQTLSLPFSHWTLALGVIKFPPPIEMGLMPLVKTRTGVKFASGLF